MKSGRYGGRRTPRAALLDHEPGQLLSTAKVQSDILMNVQEPSSQAPTTATSNPIPNQHSVPESSP